MLHHFICSNILCGPASSDAVGNYELAKVFHKYPTERKSRGRYGVVGVVVDVKIKTKIKTQLKLKKTIMMDFYMVKNYIKYVIENML